MGMDTQSIRERNLNYNILSTEALVCASRKDFMDMYIIEEPTISIIETKKTMNNKLSWSFRKSLKSHFESILNLMVRHGFSALYVS